MNSTDVTWDVAVVGAGASGLMAALELAKAGFSVHLLEARPEPGGRIRSCWDATGMRMDLGPEFIHGQPPLTLELLNRYDIPYKECMDRFWTRLETGWSEEPFFLEAHPEFMQRLIALNEDVSAASFIAAHFPETHHAPLTRALKRFVEGYDTADMERVSMLRLKEEWLQEGEWGSWLPEGGYHRLMAAMTAELQELGVPMSYGIPVTQIAWKPGKVILNEGSSDCLQASKAILTMPPPLWGLDGRQPGAWSFAPELPRLRQAMSMLGYGGVIKWVLHFSDSFWAPWRGNGASFFLSEAKVPTWWDTRSANQSVLVGWLGGPAANTFKTWSSEDLVAMALEALHDLFGLRASQLRSMLLEAYVANWCADPWSRGSYSYPVVHQTPILDVLRSPQEDTLYLAGEALYQGPYVATVEAALIRGQEVARQIKSSV